jgi:hypothetical protein
LRQGLTLIGVKPDGTVDTSFGDSGFIRLGFKALYGNATIIADSKDGFFLVQSFFQEGLRLSFVLRQVAVWTPLVALAAFSGCIRRLAISSMSCMMLRLVQPSFSTTLFGTELSL